MANQQFFDLAVRFVQSALVLCTMGLFYFAFTIFHLRPLWRFSNSRGVIEAIIFNSIFCIAVACYARWILMPSGAESQHLEPLLESGHDRTAPGGMAAEATGLGWRSLDVAKFLPVVFVSCCIVGLYLIYTVFHLLSSSNVILEAVCFNALTILLVVCYGRSIITPPGAIPSEEEEEDRPCAHAHDDRESRRLLSHDGLPSSKLQERKRSTGQRRHCKWCAEYKPDRTHHCRTCGKCVLKMDHHCPWIINCVGFRNHKYFFLLIFYATLDCNFIVWTMLESVRDAVASGSSVVAMFLLLFGETLAIFTGLLALVFFSFHLWLMLKGMTTIEFLEKSTKKGGHSISPYDFGVFRNIQAVLGDNPLLWLLPCSPPSGTGVSFQRRLAGGDADMASGQGQVRPHRRPRHKHAPQGHGELYYSPYGSVQCT
jgi:hypothetical protein